MRVARRGLLSGVLGFGLAGISTSSKAQPSANKPIRILSIDGGGIRGIAAAQMLTHLEAAFALKGSHLLDHFDILAGTSTGSLIAAGLATSDDPSATYKSCKDIVAAYEKHGKAIFRKKITFDLKGGLTNPQYDNRGLHKILSDSLKDIRMGELKRNLVIPFYNMHKSAGPVIAMGGPNLKSNDSVSSLKLRSIVQASASAPTYFNPIYFDSERDDVSLRQAEGKNSDEYFYRGADGGVFANNPSITAFAVAKSSFGAARDVVIVSMGCGRGKASETSDMSSMGVYEWVSPPSGVPLIDAMQRGQSDHVDILMQLLLDRDGGSNYFRFQFNLIEMPSMAEYLLKNKKSRIDDAKSDHLAALKASADEYMSSAEGQKKITDALGQLS